MTAHAFNCEGGEIFYRLGAAWFVSYAYHCNLDKNEMSWNNESISPKSISSRKSKFNNSTDYHHGWLLHVLSMNDNKLSNSNSKVGLCAHEIKTMASELLKSGY